MLYLKIFQSSRKFFVFTMNSILGLKTQQVRFDKKIIFETTKSHIIIINVFRIIEKTIKTSKNNKSQKKT